MSDASDGAEVRLEIGIDATPETVFALLTDPTQMKTWLAEIVEAEARPGGGFLISAPSGLTVEGTYLEVIPHRRVMFTWGRRGRSQTRPVNRGVPAGARRRGHAGPIAPFRASAIRGRIAPARLGLFRTCQT